MRHHPLRKFCIRMTALLLLSTACSHHPAPDSKKSALVAARSSQWKPQTFISHPDWLGLALDPEPTEQLRRQLEAVGGVPLKTRGEAHITVISPPEFAKLKSKISMSELDSGALRLDIQRTHWKPLCVAQGKRQNDLTYYVVVESDGLMQLRREFLRLFVKAGGDPMDFDLANYHPHITIGFTNTDLYDSDGVIKDTRNCSFDLVTPDGENITSWNL